MKRIRRRPSTRGNNLALIFIGYVYMLYLISVRKQQQQQYDTCQAPHDNSRSYFNIKNAYVFIYVCMCVFASVFLAWYVIQWLLALLFNK